MNTIDHTLLRPDATQLDIETLCQEVLEYGFCTACVHPEWISVCKKFPVKIATTVAFPYGMTLTKAKVKETEVALAAGADEVDMVAQIGHIKEGRYDFVEADIRAVVEVDSSLIIKVIIEAGLLTDEEIVNTSKCVEQAGAHFVKSSTGVLSTGATIDAIKLMRTAVSPQMGVKASGGIRTLEQMEAFLAVGATRIGSSSGINIYKSTVSKGPGPLDPLDSSQAIY